MANPDSTQPKQRTCFVVMGFGKKTDFETGRILDLDKSYLNMIKPAVEAAGLKCIRADEIVHSGLIDVPMYEQLLNADVVVADLSTSNKNAFYELGVRHALRPFTTIIVAEDGIKTFPFDINHVAVRQYHHLGEDIGYGEVMRFQKMLTSSIQEIVGQDTISHDSPVYAFLQNLVPPAIQKLQEAVLAAAAAPTLAAAAAPDVAAEAAAMTHSMLMAAVDEAQNRGDWVQTKSLLELVRNQQAQSRALLRQAATVEPTQPDQESPYLLQRLALATYKAKLPTEEAALQAARDLLLAFDPQTSNDTETLGLWGAIHKRRWDLAKRTGTDAARAEGLKDLDEAVRAYERGFYLRNDYYNGINLAFMLNVRAAEAADPAEAIADFVQARRVRQEVATICQAWLAAREAQPNGAQPPADAPQPAGHYWVLATLAEAYVGLGDEEKAAQTLAEANALAPQPGMKSSTEDQLASLRKLLSINPLRFISAA